MTTYATPDEIKREIHSTLAARQDLGAAYDEHLADAFMDKLGAKVAQELRQRPDLWPATAPTRTGPWLTTERRLKIALGSLLLCLVLVALVMMVGGNPNAYTEGGWDLALLSLVVVVNLALNLRLHLRLHK